jgi:phosphohistidine phosphatase
VQAYLIHHAQAVGPDVDPQRPLSSDGLAHAERLALAMKERGATPVAIWHSGKLRARQTAEAVLRHVAPFAEFKMVRGLRPDDPVEIVATALRGESRDIAVVGHMPHLPSLLVTLAGFDVAMLPTNGVVELRSDDGGVTWAETWRWTGRP